MTAAPRLAQRIARFSTALVLAFLLALGVGSWLLIRSEQAHAQQQLLEKEMTLHADRVGALINTLQGQLSRAAQSSLISTALVDSAGKDAYLVPYLQGLRRVEGVPIALAFTDFEGKEIARNGMPGFTDAHFAWLRTVLEKPDRPSAVIMGAGESAELVAAELIHYSRLKTPEGALMYRVMLRDLAEPTAPLHWDGDGFRPAPGALWQALRVPDAWRHLGLTIALEASAVPPESGWRLLSLFLMAGVPAIVLALWASGRLGRHLTSDLQRLSEFAGEVVGKGFGSARASLRGTREVAQLADAVNEMLDRLNEQHRRLQEESEAKFRNLVENIPGAAYRRRLRPERTMEYVSPGIEELTGYPASDFVGNGRRDFDDIVHPDDVRAYLANDEQPTHVLEYRIRRADAQERWIWERSRTSRDASGAGVFTEGVLFDVTDRKQAESELIEAKRLAEAANLAKSQFLATMSHELRTPMNGVLGMAELLMLPDLPQAKRIEFAQTVMRSGRTLLALLNDILDLSQIETGKITLHYAPCVPADVIEEIAALFTTPAIGKGLRMSTDVRFAPGQAYQTDPVRLRQMLGNLVNNAVKFTDRGGVTVGGRELARGESSALLEFFVVDTGIGVPKEQQNLLFKRFTQVDGSSTRRHGGSGLGLSIVRNLAELIGGTAGMESEPGGGSRFWIRIPAAPVVAWPERAAHTDQPAGAVDDSPSAGPDSATRLVYLVEDHPANRKVVETMLKVHGVRVSSFENGQQALDAIVREPAPDLVLMDCQMPLMDGIAATAAIRQWERITNHPRIPIVALTAGAFEADRNRCLAAGMDDFLAKPVNMKNLMEIVTHWSADARSGPGS